MTLQNWNSKRFDQRTMYTSVLLWRIVFTFWKLYEWKAWADKVCRAKSTWSLKICAANNLKEDEKKKNQWKLERNIHFWWFRFYCVCAHSVKLNWKFTFAWTMKSKTACKPKEFCPFFFSSLFLFLFFSGKFRWFSRMDWYVCVCVRHFCFHFLYILIDFIVCLLALWWCSCICFLSFSLYIFFSVSHSPLCLLEKCQQQQHHHHQKRYLNPIHTLTCTSLNSIPSTFRSFI